MSVCISILLSIFSPKTDSKTRSATPIDQEHFGAWPSWVIFLFVGTVAAGIFFRFYNLGDKVYWSDECVTAMRVSGYTAGELKREIFNGEITSVKKTLKYLYPAPDRTLMHVLKSSAMEDPNIPPVYYVMARLWTNWLGYSLENLRTLSVIISLFALPLMCWLCLECFKLSGAAWTAVALLSISPFHVLYAQEARFYSLWTVAILLSNLVFLRALRLNTKRDWIVYGLTLSLGLYSHLFFAFVVIGHVIYLLLNENSKDVRKVTSFFCSTLGGFAAFIPWLLVIIKYFSVFLDITAWATRGIPVATLTYRWASDLTSVFFDVSFLTSDLLTNTLSKPDVFQQIAALIIILVLALVSYSILYAVKSSPKRIWLFIALSSGIGALSLMLTDLALGGQRSVQSRYLVPFYLGIQLSVAYGITLWSGSRRSIVKCLGKTTAVPLISGGLISCIINSRLEAPRNKQGGNFNLRAARIINQEPESLIISDTRWHIFLPFSLLLKPKTALILMKEGEIPKIPSTFRNGFLFMPSDNLRNELAKQGYRAVPLTPPPHRKFTLWKLIGGS